MAMNLCSIYIYFYGRCFSFIAKRCVVVSVINLGIQHLCRCPGSISIMPCNWRLCFTLSVIYIFILLYSIRLHVLGAAHATNNNMAIILYNSLSNFFHAHIQPIECSLLVTMLHGSIPKHSTIPSRTLFVIVILLNWNVSISKFIRIRCVFC